MSTKRVSILFISILMMGLLMLTPTYAAEGTVDLNAGSVIIDGEYLTTNNIGEDDMITISSYTGNNTISVTATSQEVNITLDNVAIDATSAGACAFKIDSGSTVNLILKGHNVLKSGEDKAGLSVLDGATLIIDKISGGTDDGNALIAIGGNNAGAIGRTRRIYSSDLDSNIEIRGGKITARGGGTEGVGIGGNVKISGGIVKANGAKWAAGIGGSTGRIVEIRGGKVTATGEYGAGIGGSHGSEAGSIKISGGEVIATSRLSAGIGSGNVGEQWDVEISGGKVVAKSEKGAGIGGAYMDDETGGNIEISGGNVIAESEKGAGIGGGRGPYRDNENRGWNIEISNGVVMAKSKLGAGIGSGYQDRRSCGSITIKGGQISAIGGSGAGIGSGEYSGSGGDIEISSGALVYAATNNLDASDIGAGYRALSNGTLKIIGRETVVLIKSSTGRIFDNGLSKFSAFKTEALFIPKELEDLGVKNEEVGGRYYLNPRSITVEDINVAKVAEQIFTGIQIEPKLSISDIDTPLEEDITLEEGVDYKVTYSENINVGQATVYITGIGKYKDEITTHFNIKKGTPVITASSFTKTYGDAPFSIGASNDKSFPMTYAVDSAGVITVDTIGNVTIKKTGTTSITISTAEEANYNSATKIITITVNEKPTSGGSSISSSKPLKSSVGSESSNIGRVKIKTIEGVKTAQAQIDSNRLDRELKTVDTDSKMKIAVKDKAVDVKLDLKNIENMQDKKVVLEIATENEIFALDTDKINVNKISERIGENIDLDDIEVNVEIKPSNNKTKALVKKIVSQKNLELVSEPVDFNVKAKHDYKTIPVEKFKGMVERSIKIAKDVNTEEVTTAVVIEKDGTLRPVPTHIERINGTDYAMINSETNATYFLVSNKKEYTDMENHWAKDDANNMASRLIFEDTENFEPEKVIQRKDMAKYLVKAIGLKPDNGLNPFGDVTEEYTGYVGTAYEYGLIDGTSDTSFSADDILTREQAMVLIYRAAKILGAVDETHAANMSVYTDYEDVSSWARESIMWTVGSGIMKGVSDTELSPKSNLSKAEIAALLNRFLVSMKLID